MRIDFFYDVVSPYSYFAFVMLRRYQAVWKMDLRLYPALLGGVMKATGNVPPATLPARAPYMMRDLGRCSDYYQIPLQVPSDFPTSTLKAMRILTAIDQAQQGKTDPALSPATTATSLADASLALWQHHWGQGLPMNDETIVSALQQAGFSAEDTQRWLQRANDADVKNALIEATNNAVEAGAFGMPMLLCYADDDVAGKNPEMFFGGDRLFLVAHQFGLPWYGAHPPAQTNT